jgi:hypothetical protein
LAKVRRTYIREKRTARDIAQTTNLSRDTVRKYAHLERVEEPRYRRRAMPTKLTPHHEAIMLALKADARRHPKRDLLSKSPP